MTIEFAILGLLAAEPRTGYDLKKVFSASEALPWSGNNNQVYRAVTDLHRRGLVALDVQEPRGGPSRKLYSVTDEGRLALASWLETPIPLPEFRSEAVVRVAAGLADVPEVARSVLDAYLEQLRVQLAMAEERARRADGAMRLVEGNTVAHYRAEIAWVEHARNQPGREEAEA